MQELKREPEDPDDSSYSLNTSKENDLIQQILNSQEVKIIMQNFQSLSPGKREEISGILSNISSEIAPHGDNTDISFSAPASQILKMMTTPATETLPQLGNLTQELQHSIGNNNGEQNNESNLAQPLKKARMEPSESAESNCNNSSSFYTLYSLNCGGYDPKAVTTIVSNMQEQYNKAVNTVNNRLSQTVVSVASIGKPSYFRELSQGISSPALGSGVLFSQNAISPSEVSTVPRLRVFMIPQEKGRSRNFDYVGGTITQDPDAEYHVFCRCRPIRVPFAVGVDNVRRAEAKLKVQVMFTKIKSKVPVRCSNHKEGDNTVWREQLMISTDPDAKSLSYEEGHGFIISPVPERCELLFLCRNSCRQGPEKDWQLTFTLMDNNCNPVAVRIMPLRVCEVPHRDIAKSKVKYEWNPFSTLDNPTMRILPFKEDIQETPTFLRAVTDVFPIYLSGYDAYCEIMQYVSNLEMRRKQENPVICHATEYMRDWNRTTPIIRFVQPVCGVETPVVLEKFGKKDIRTLGDLYHKFTPDFFTSMQISPIMASQLAALYLNWRNIIEYYEMSVCKRDLDLDDPRTPAL